MNGKKLIIVGLCVFTNTLISWYFNGKSLLGVDDANIYFIFMQNLSEGGGFVYNLGSEKIEPTSILWTIIGSFVFIFSNSPETVLIIANIIFITFTLYKITCFIDKHFPTKSIISRESLLFLILLSIIPGYFDWTILSLMDTGIWSSLLLLASINILDDFDNKNKQNLEFITLTILIILCRPDGLLWAPFLTSLKLFKYYTHHNSFLETISKNKILIYSNLFTIIILVSWRLNYFGYPFPNSYYAKVSFDVLHNIKIGIFYVYKYCRQNPFLIIVLFMSLKIILGHKLIKVSKYINIVQYSFLIIILSLIIPLYTGGDHFGYSRYIQATVPVIWLCFLFSCHALKFPTKNSYVNFALILFIGFIPRNSYFEYFDHDSIIKKEWIVPLYGRQEGLKLNKMFNNHHYYPSIAVITAGGIPYAYKGFTYDLMGLNNVEMAHAKKVKPRNLLKHHASFDKSVFYKQKPELIINGRQTIQYSDFDPEKFLCIEQAVWGMGLLGNIDLDERFNEEYVFAAIRNNNYNYMWKGYCSRKFLEKLDKNHFTVFECD